MLDEIGLPPGLVTMVAGGSCRRTLAPSRRGQGVVHRIHARGPGGGGSMRGQPDQGQPRTRRQVGRAHARRCRTGKSRRGRAVGQLVQQRPDLQRADPPPGASQRHDEYVDALAAEMSTFGWATRTIPAPNSARWSPAASDRVRDYIRIGQNEGARMVLGGADMPGARPRLVCLADVVRGRRQQHAHCARRDLRPGDHRHPVSGRRGRRGHCQRFRLRPGRFGVDRRRRPGITDRARFAPAPSASTRATRWIPSRRLAASRAAATAAS